MRKDDLIASILSDAAERIIRDNVLDNDEAKSIIEEYTFNNYDGADLNEIVEIVDKVFGKLRGQLGPISYLMEDDSVNEIMVNGRSSIYVERDGNIEKTKDGFDSTEELEQVIRRVAGSVRREINEMNPILDARLKDGSRVNAVLRNVALDGPSLTIRKFRRRKITMAEIVESGGLTVEAAESLRILVESGYNLFVSGGTSSGKTTFLNALSEYIPRTERIITIEDSAELQMDYIPNLVRMECRNKSSSGQGEISMADLIKTSLRMRPDRIIVGEVRGKEVSDMLQALNTGHSGMSTGHGNSIKGMLRRLEALYISNSEMPLDAVRAQIVEAIDIMVHLARFGDGSRRVLEISEIVGFDGSEYNIEPIYKIDEDLKLYKAKDVLVNDMRLKLRGISNV